MAYVFITRKNKIQVPTMFIYISIATDKWHSEIGLTGKNSQGEVEP